MLLLAIDVLYCLRLYFDASLRLEELLLTVPHVVAVHVLNIDTTLAEVR